MSAATTFFAVLVGLAGVACDFGTRVTDAAHGPALRLVSTTPSNGEGVGCNPNDPFCGAPREGAIVVKLDRPLEPNSATRQAISLYTGAPNVGSPFLSPTYDVLERTVRFEFGGALLPRVLYQVELTLPKQPGDAALRAYDGAPLVEGAVPSHFSFLTSATTAPPDVSGALFEPTCDDIVGLFKESCSGSCCHSGDSPKMGLSLGSVQGLLDTAIGRASHQTERADTLGVTYKNPPRFGLAMPIIEPRRPANSYLVYKLLIHEENLLPCSQSCGPFETLPGAQRCEPLLEGERERLRDWFVQGEPMPLGLPLDESGCTMPPRQRPLDCASMRAITRWIATGAHCP